MFSRFLQNGEILDPSGSSSEPLKFSIFFKLLVSNSPFGSLSLYFFISLYLSKIALRIMPLSLSRLPSHFSKFCLTSSRDIEETIVIWSYPYPQYLPISISFFSPSSSHDIKYIIFIWVWFGFGVGYSNRRWIWSILLGLRSFGKSFKLICFLSIYLVHGFDSVHYVLWSMNLDRFWLVDSRLEPVSILKEERWGG